MELLGRKTGKYKSELISNKRVIRIKKINTFSNFIDKTLQKGILVI